MYQLPQKVVNLYRGKYPDRISQLGYSNSLSQQVIGGFLSINRPIHIELNNGIRYIAAADEINMAMCKPSVSVGAVLKKPVTEIIPLTQERYDEMLTLVQKVRGEC